MSKWVVMFEVYDGPEGDLMTTASAEVEADDDKVARQLAIERCGTGDWGKDSLELVAIYGPYEDAGNSRNKSLDEALNSGDGVYRP